MKKLIKKLGVGRIVIVAIIILAIIAAVIISIILSSKESTIIVDGNEIEYKEEYKYLLEEENVSLDNDNFYTRQYKAWLEIEKKYKNGKYTINNPLVVLNPFDISPLTALVLFKTDSKENVKTTLVGKKNNDLVTHFESSNDHIIPVYGLYPDHVNVLKIEAGSLSNSIDIKTNKIGNYINGKVEFNKLVGDKRNEFLFATSSLGLASAAYDTEGELRWFLARGYTKGMTMLQNGHLLISTDDPGINRTSTSGVVEVDMLGFVYHEYNLAGGYHHDATELKNGNIIALTSNEDDKTLADYIVELDRDTGKVVKSWDLREIVNKIDPEITKYYVSWGWINSVFFDEKTESLILSFRNMNSVVSVGYNTGEINWILGDIKYWSNKFEKYMIKGIGKDFIYPLGQHSVSITKDGNLQIYNNGYNSHNEKVLTCKSLTNNESYAMVYKLDLANKTAEVTWKYGGKEYFSYALSSYTSTTENNMLFSSGWHFTDETPFDSDDCNQFNASTYESFIIEFDENHTPLFKMNIKEGKFEVLKTNIYNLESISITPKKLNEIKNYKPAATKISLTKEYEYNKLTKEEIAKLKNAQKLDYAMYADKNRVFINGSFTLNDTANILLVDLKGNGYNFVSKKSGSPVVTDANANLLPKTRYYIYVEVNGTVYDALQYLDVK